MNRYEELMKGLRDRQINFNELEELKKLLEDKIKECEEKERCDEALNEHIILRMVEELIDRHKRL